MKVKTEVVVQEVKRYIAEDGKTFLNEDDCLKYEKGLARARLKEKLDKIERCYEAWGMTPLDGCEHMEYHDYKWYRPKTEEEASVLNEWYEIEYGIDNEEIGQWICIEECDDSSWSYALSYSIMRVKELFGLLGYDVTITKKEDNNV